MRAIFTAILAATLYTSPAIGRSAGESLVKPPLSGFVIGYDAAGNGSSMSE